jgi:phenylacetate-CoA ligase
MTRPEFFLSVVDRLRGTSIRKYLAFFRQTVTWSPQEVRAYQLEKIQDLISYCYNHVPFYRRRLEENNLTPESIKTLEDLGRIPPLTRMDLQEYALDMLSDQKEELSFETAGSSGTTGIPISYCQDMDAISAGVAAGMLGWELSGWRFGQRSLHIWGNPTSIKHWKKIGSRVKRILYNQKNVAATELNYMENFPYIIRMIERFQPSSIDGYTSAIHSLAQYCREHEVDLPKPRNVFTTAENLLPHHKNVIEETLGPVSDGYGCGEINGIAICPVGDERYFIIEPHVVVEAADNGSSGSRDILVTDLDNRVMPLIRYQVGDMIGDVHEATNDAPVGFRYFDRVIGRSSDVVRLENGRVIQPLNLLGGTLFRRIGGITKHKVAWNGRCLTFFFETDCKFDLQEAHRLISTELQEYGAPYRIEVVQRLLPGASGKFRYFEIVE